VELHLPVLEQVELLQQQQQGLQLHLVEVDY
jgi:hypothetical protein